jgi:hypothetical protein
MIKKINLLLLLLVLPAAAGLFADDNIDPLWQKAVKIAEQNNAWIPGKLHHTSRQLSGSGKIKSQESVIIDYQQNDQTVEAVFISGQRDNEPLTETDERIQEILKESMLDDSSLFYNFQGKDLKVTASDKTRIIGEHECRGFDYEFIKESDDSKDIRSWGTVWLENEKGIPLLNEMSFDPPRKMIKNMSIITHYNCAEDAWYMNKVQMSFSISLVLMKINMEIDRIYSKFWRFEKA